MPPTARSVVTTGIVAATLLLFFRVAYKLLTAAYFWRLIFSRDISTFDRYADYDEVGASAFLLLELLLLLLVFRPEIQSLEENKSGTSSNLAWYCFGGAILGVISVAMSLPFTPWQLQPFGIVSLVNESLLFSPRLLLPVILLLTLPWLSEKVFRGFIFRSLRTRTNAAFAVTINATLFALCWPLTSAVTAFFAGLAAAILYERSKSVLPGGVAIFFASVSSTAILVWRA
jgi:membrane protease YdiL (CAAX protease family)